MCNFQHGTMECTGEGYLWDADADGWDPDDHTYPCPKCNTKAYLLDLKETAESCSSGNDNGARWTGDSIWRNAVRYAEQENPEAAKQALAEIGVVEALRPADNAEGYEVVKYFYGADLAPAALPNPTRPH